MRLNKKLISCFAIEVTRRCNLNCDFCAKGEAQGMDITKETIDKTLDEVSEAYIHMLSNINKLDIVYFRFGFRKYFTND